MKATVIGPASSVLGFKALGLDVSVVSGPGEAEEAWDSLDADRYAVIFVTEDVHEALAGRIEAYRGKAFPVVAIIPPVSGSEGTAMSGLKSLVDKAIGMEMPSFGGQDSGKDGGPEHGRYLAGG